MSRRLTIATMLAFLLAVGLLTMAQVSPSMRLVFKDEGVSQGRAGILDVTGSTAAVTVSGNTATLNISGVSTHNLLSATHGDTSAASVTRGDMLVGNSTPAWARLPVGTYGQGVWTDGTDVQWESTSYIGGFVASNFATSSTTYVDVTGLTVPLPANTIFAFDCYGTYATTDNLSTATNGLGISLNGTGGTGQAAVYTLWIQNIARNTSGNNTTSTTPFAIRNENTFDSMTALTAVAQTGSLVFQMKGFYYTGTSGTSTFAVRVRSENGSPQTANIQVGSYCLFTKQG